MRNDRLPEVAVDDYDLTTLKQIKVRGLNYNVMPRYLEHYVAHDYEAYSGDLWNTYATAAETVVDIGAHFGFYSLVAAKANEKSTVYSFEPVPENAEILRRNCEANDINSVHITQAALSATEGRASFNIPWASDSAGFFEHPNAKTMRTLDVEVKRLDDCLDGKKVDLIKIDTEGNEIPVLKGAKASLSAKNVKMFIEFNPACQRAAGYEPEELLVYIDKMGFNIYFIFEETRQLVRFRADEFKDWKNIVAEEGYANILCIRKEANLDVLIASHSAQLGGAELAMVDYTKDLMMQGIVVHVILPENGPLEKRLSTIGIPLEIIPSISWARTNVIEDKDLRNQDYINTRAVEAMVRSITRLRPDIALSNTIAIPWLAIAANATRLPHTWFIHEFGDIDHRLLFDYSYEEVLRIVDLLSNVVFTNSLAVTEHIAQHIGKSKIKQLYYKMEMPAAKPLLHSPFLQAKSLKVILVGRFAASKGQHLAIEAVHKLIDEGHSVELALLGQLDNKAYVKEVKEYRTTHQMEKSVHILGFHENPADYMNAADVVIMASSNEAFGRVTVEAQLLGKPVVGSNSGGTKEIIVDNKTGYLFEPNNARDLADKLKRFITKPAQTTMMGDAARTHAAQFVNSTITLDVIKTLQRAIEEKTSTTSLFYEKFFRTYIQIEDDYQAKEMSNQQELHHALEALSKANEELKHFHALYTRLRKSRVLRAGLYARRKLKSRAKPKQ